MKNIRVLWALLALAFWQPAQADTFSYYRYGKLTPMPTADWSRIFVTTRTKPTQSEASRIGKILPDAFRSSVAPVMHGPSNGFVLTLNNTQGISAENYRQKLAPLLADPSVSSVLPAFLVSGYSQDDPVFVSGKILIKVPSAEVLNWKDRVASTGCVLTETLRQGPHTVLVVQAYSPSSKDVFALARRLQEAGPALLVEPNIVFTGHNSFVPNDPSYSAQYFLSQASNKDIDAPEAWDILAAANAPVMTVAVIDGNGFQLNHPDLAGNITRPYDAVNDDSIPDPENQYSNHGTPCAGLVAALTNNSLGVASVGGVRLKVAPCIMGYGANSAGNFSTDGTIVARAASWLITVARVVASSHSYGFGSGSFATSVESSYISMRNSPRNGLGAVVLASTGNAGQLNPSAYPASFAAALGVGASDANDLRASFSNYGTLCDIAAPGVSDYTLDRTGADGYNTSGDYTSFSGTSAACPAAAAVVGLIGCGAPAADVTSLENLLQTSAEKVGGYTYSMGVSGHPLSTWSQELGYGRINARLALQKATGSITNANESILPIACGQNVTGTTAGTINDISAYTGYPVDESGPDQTYSFTVSTRSSITINVTNLGTADLDIFLMASLNSYSILAYGTETISATLNPGTYYINVDGYQGSSGPFSLSLDCYCIPTSACGDGAFIARVSLNGQSTDSATRCDGSYSSNPSPVFEAYWGQNASFRISNAPQNKAYGQAYIDFNADGDFDDAGEMVFSSVDKAFTHVGTISLPINSPYNTGGTIATKLRFRSAYDTLPTNACMAVQYGETEDYNIEIYPPTIVLDDEGRFVCPGRPFTLTVEVIPAGVLPDTTPVQVRRSDDQTVLGFTTLGNPTFTFPLNLAGQVVPIYLKPLHFPDSLSYWADFQVGYNATITSVTPGTRCGAGPVRLVAKGNPVVTVNSYAYSQDTVQLRFYRYYSAASGGSPVFTSTTDTATTPSLTNSATYYVSYSYGPGQPGTATSCESFDRTPITATVAAPPTLTGFTPANGQPGTLVTLTGNNLSGVTDVKFNGNSAASYNTVSNTQIGATAPANATTGPISVLKPGCPVVSSANLFTVPAGTANDLDWRWVRRGITGVGGSAQFNRVRTEAFGNFYAAGYLAGSNVSLEGGSNPAQVVSSTGGKDGLLTRYNRQGNLAWVVRFCSSGDDEIQGLATDKFGYAYVSGYFSNTMTIYPATGSSQALTSAGGTDGFVAKIHPDGHIMYAFKFGAAGNDQATGIDVAPDLRYYVAGSFIGNTTIQGISGTAVNLTSRGNSDAFMAKFSDVGTMYWLIQAGGAGNDFAYGAAADKTGGGYLMGSYESTATFNSSLGGTTPISKTVVGGSDGFVLGVSITGALNWVASMGGSTNENVRDVAPDPRGTGVVAVGGFSQTASFGPSTLTATGFYDAFAVRLTNNGSFEWATKAGGFGQERAWGVRLDKTGNPWLSMSFAQNTTVFGASNLAYSQGGLDGLLVKLDAATGASTLVAQVAGTAGDDIAYGVDTTLAGGAITCGSLMGNTRFGLVGPYAVAGIQDAWLARYSTSASAFREEGADAAAIFSDRLHLYPNPSTQSFAVDFDGETAQMSIYSADGRQVNHLTIHPGHPIFHALPAGAYMVRLVTDMGKSLRGRLVVQ